MSRTRPVGVATCQTLLDAGKPGARYCGAPALSLGIVGERDICPTCHLRGLDYRWALIERSFEIYNLGGEWIARMGEHVADYDRWTVRCLREGKPLSEVYESRREVALRVLLHRLALARCPVPADATPPMFELTEGLRR